MATLDLQDQEQLDNLKAFWAKWGTLISAVTTLGLLAFAGWNAWTWWQRDQGTKAGMLYGSIEAAVEAKELDKAGRLLGEMQTRYAKAAYTSHAALKVAHAQTDDKALPLLQWVATQGTPFDLKELANLRLAGVHLEAKRFKESSAALDNVKSPAYAALVADRRGDLALLQNDAAKAREQFKIAYQEMDESIPYRRLLEAKLMSLGVDPSGLAKTKAVQP
jgi:predicted negative regulator of RcsB-dependent stress response